MSVSPFAPTVALAVEPLTVPFQVVSAPRGSVRRTRTAPTGVGRAVTAVAVLGRLVTLAALLVLAGAAGGLVDGVPAGEAPTVVATIGGSGH